MVVGFIVGVLLVVVGAKVVVEVDLGFVVVGVVVSFVFLLLLSFLVFCVFAVNFSDLRFHHFLFYYICHSNKISLKLQIIYTSKIE